MEVRNNLGMSGHQQSFGIKINEEMLQKTKEGLEYFSKPANMKKFLEETEVNLRNNREMMAYSEKSSFLKAIKGSLPWNDLRPVWFKKLAKAENKTAVLKELIDEKRHMLEKHKKDLNLGVILNEDKTAFEIAGINRIKSTVRLHDGKNYFWADNYSFLLFNNEPRAFLKSFLNLTKKDLYQKTQYL